MFKGGVRSGHTAASSSDERLALLPFAYSSADSSGSDDDDDRAAAGRPVDLPLEPAARSSFVLGGRGGRASARAHVSVARAAPHALSLSPDLLLCICGRLCDGAVARLQRVSGHGARHFVVKIVFPWVASRASMLYLAARTHSRATVCLHAARACIVATREFWTDWLSTETPCLYIPQNVLGAQACLLGVAGRARGRGALLAPALRAVVVVGGRDRWRGRC